MKITLISDTHDQHDKLNLPGGDILIHAGDLTMSGSVYSVQKALDWLKAQKEKYRHIVFIAGNHDFAFEDKQKELNWLGLIYLEDALTNIDGCLIYGTPWQPYFGGWAFNVFRGPEIAKKWVNIPQNLDILITHGPPHMILDRTAPKYGNQHAGCEELAKAIVQKKPKINVFGHIHGGYGCVDFGPTRYYNASVVNEDYKLANEPWEIEL